MMSMGYYAEIGHIRINAKKRRVEY